MPLFGRKERQLPRSRAPEMPPSLSDADLGEAAQLMDSWDASLGNDEAVENCLEMIARRGGFMGVEATLSAAVGGSDVGDVLDRPWRWWTEAARLAQLRGDDVLAGRIFLFTWLFATQMVGKMNAATQACVGLGHPGQAYKSIAGIAVGSLGRLEPDLVLHESVAGAVDVGMALRLAEAVAGDTAGAVESKA